MKPSRFQFQEPILTQIEFKLNNDFIFKEEEIELNPSFIVRIPKYNFKNYLTDVILQLEIGGFNDNEPFHIKATMQAKFRWTNDIDESELKILLSQNAPSVLLSYLRPIIANITNSSPFPAYNLPLMNFTQEQINFEQ